jgi:N,N'-diacetyllegionaminate synthase
MHPFESKRNPVFFIAEIGGNHEGDFEYAQRLTKLAIESGADAVKFQLYSGDTLVSTIESPDRNAHFKRFELSREQYVSLALTCERAGAMFMASVWDTEMLDWINPHISIHKVGSGDLTCYPIIRRLVETGKPIILSTGLSSLEEVLATVQYIRRLDARYIEDRKLALLQCTSSYPTPDEDANVDVITTLRQASGLPTGYSNHTLGVDAIEGAVALGAEIIEAHFTDTREGKTFRDHMISLTRDEVRALLPKLRRLRTLRGSAEKRLTRSEETAGHQLSFRRSVYAARDIAAGEALTEINLTVLRPAHGISATDYDKLVGRHATRAIRAHEVLKADDFS